MGVSQGSPKLKFSKHSHVIYRRKSFLMLIAESNEILLMKVFWALNSKMKLIHSWVSKFDP